MIKKIILLLIIISTAKTLHSQAYKLVWNDEFNTATIDLSKWNFETGNGSGGWGNNELEYYTNRVENAHIDTGTLVITAKKESYSGFQYTSTRMHTKDKGHWKYGKIEMRAKIPKGIGTWPAFWMLPQSQSYGTNYWPDNGEIDIMEHVGYVPNSIYGTVHVNKYYGGSAVSKQIIYSGVENDFHTYGIYWSADSIKWYVDNNLYNTYTKGTKTWQEWPFDKEFFILLNFAIGGNWGGQGKQIVDTTIFPQNYIIDYIRVYQRDATDIESKNASSDKINVSPNPVKDFLNVSISNDIDNKLWYSIYDSCGSLITSPTLCKKNSSEIDFSKYKTGIYMIVFQNNKIQKNFKVLKI